MRTIDAPEGRDPAAEQLALYRELFAATAVLLTFAAYLPYIRAIRAGNAKPHLLSWLTWTLSALVVFLAQWVDGGGVGAWPVGASGAATAYIAFLAYRSRAIPPAAPIDWLFVAGAMAALPCWLLTSNPLVAVVLLTAVELAGFGPTFRLSAAHPDDEHVGFYALGAVRNGLTVAALENHSLITTLFPAAKGFACAALVVMLLHWRRRSRAQRAGRES